MTFCACLAVLLAENSNDSDIFQSSQSITRLKSMKILTNGPVSILDWIPRDPQAMVAGRDSLSQWLSYIRNISEQLFSLPLWSWPTVFPSTFYFDSMTWVKSSAFRCNVTCLNLKPVLALFLMVQLTGSNGRFHGFRTFSGHWMCSFSLLCVAHPVVNSWHILHNKFTESDGGCF